MPKRTAVKRGGRQLADLANVGPATLQDFQVLGIRSVAQLARRNPWRLYDALCRLTGERHDPCVIDVFLATAHEARGGRPRAWWSFTAERKEMVGAGRSGKVSHRNVRGSLKIC